MSNTVLFRRSEMRFEHFGGPPGSAEIARLVGPDTSKTMGAGIATFEACSIEWTVLYDEVIVVLEGRFRLVVGDDRFECGPGDVLWIPENTALKYEADERAVCFYALHPVDWRARHGLE